MDSPLKECPPSTNILLVDANYTTLINMSQIMKQYDYEVKVETDGEIALEYLTNCEHDINLVIWDFHMPGINGIEALKAIGSEMNIPVVIMSDDNRKESVMKATIHGACDYVIKPVKEEEISIIWQHIVRKKMMKSNKPVLIPAPVQSDMAQSSRLDDQVKETLAKRTRTTWTSQPFQSNLVQIDNSDQQNEDNGEPNIAKKPQTEEIQLVQSDLVQTNGVDIDDDDFRFLFEDNNEENIDKENEATKLLMSTGTEETQLVQSDGVDIDHDDFRFLFEDNCEENIDKIEENEATKLLMSEETQLVQTDGVDLDDDDFMRLLFEDNGEENIKNQKEKTPRKPVVRRLTWTGNLQQKFLEAIERVGGAKKATTKILLKCMRDDMKIEGLTKNNLSCHLQRYRMSLLDPKISNQQTQGIGSSSSLQGSNNVHTSSSSYLLNDQAMNSIQQNQYQNDFVTSLVNKNQFITNPRDRFSYFDDIHEHKRRKYQLSNQQQQYHESANQQQQYQSSNQQASNIYARDVEVIHPSLPYDPQANFFNGYNVNQ